MKGKRVYADSAASARPFPAAIKAAEEAFEVYANPSAAYGNAGRARRILESSRALIAETVGAAPDEGGGAGGAVRDGEARVGGDGVPVGGGVPGSGGDVGLPVVDGLVDEGDGAGGALDGP